jgi:hypothetical protein
MKDAMKVGMKQLAKIIVINCEKRLINDTTTQECDNDGMPLWSVAVETTAPHKKYPTKLETVISEYKSLVDVEEGENLVNLAVFTMGETKGSFTSVNSYYKILNVVSEKTTVGEVFSLTNVIPPSQRKKISAATVQ